MQVAEYNDEQLEAITCQRPIVIVSAGPGSGKSHTLVGRVIHSVKNGADPSRIVVLTFTNNGARVFSERLAKANIRVNYMGTLHGFMMRLIQAYGSALGYHAHSVTILTEEAKELLLNRIRKKMGAKITDKALHEQLTPQAQLVWGEYAFELKRANMVDYDGILRDGLELLNRDLIRALVGEGDGLHELLIDERQDSGEMDVECYRHIPASRRFEVGDVDQCIFTFRGARPDLFIQSAASLGFITLERNYRSDRAICMAATKLIGHNVNRLTKGVEPVSEKEGLVTVRSYPNDSDEIYGVWSLLKAEQSSGVPYAQMAVLGRTNTIVDKYRETLRGLGIPVSSGRRRMPDDWSRVLSMVGLMVNPANDLHAEALLRAMGADDDRIFQYRAKAATSGAWLSSVSLLPNMRPVTINDALIILLAMASDASMEIVQERIKVLPEEATISDLMVDLWHRKGWEEDLSADEGLTVSTIHGAKGREWDVVFVVAMEEGILPSRADIGELEEERRLCFVAVTRPRHRLYLTWAKQRYSWYKVNQQSPSRFISEMGHATTDREPARE